MRSSCETCCWRCYCSGGGGGAGGGDAAVAAAVAGPARAGSFRRVGAAGRRARVRADGSSPGRRAPRAGGSWRELGSPRLLGAQARPGGAGNAPGTRGPPPSPLQLLLSRRSLGARPCASLPLRACGIEVRRGSSALRLHRPRPASSAPSTSRAPPSCSLYTPAPQRCLRGRHVSPAYSWKSLPLCLHVSGATRTLCCCSLRSPPSCR